MIVIACVIAVIFLPILAINLTLIIKGNTNKDVPPSIFGVAPLAVTTGSMDGGREDGFGEGALIFVKILSDEQKNELEVGDIVTFRVAEENIFVTHRIVSINYGEDDGIVSVVTRGDANNADDGATAVSEVIGICTGSAAGLGGFALFMQTPAGITIFVGIPVIAFIALDAVRIYIYNRKSDQSKEMRDKDEEIARLKAIIDGQTEQSGENSAQCARVGEDLPEQSVQSDGVSSQKMPPDGNTNSADD